MRRIDKQHGRSILSHVSKGEETRQAILARAFELANVVGVSGPLDRPARRGDRPVEERPVRALRLEGSARGRGRRGGGAPVRAGRHGARAARAARRAARARAVRALARRGDSAPAAVSSSVRAPSSTTAPGPPAMRSSAPARTGSTSSRRPRASRSREGHFRADARSRAVRVRDLRHHARRAHCSIAFLREPDRARPRPHAPSSGCSPPRPIAARSAPSLASASIPTGGPVLHSSGAQK